MAARTTGRTIAIIVMLALCAALISGCNLTYAIATATPDLFPTETPPPSVPAPTLFPSITPLGFFPPTDDPARTPLAIVTPCPVPTGWVGYVIQAGDSLLALAVATGSTADSIAAANCIDDPNNLIAGQTIYLPRQPEVG